MKIKNFMSNLFNSVLLVLFGLSMFATVVAAELVFSPATPAVVVGQQITLSVSGTSGEITWTPSKGQIQGAGNQVTYIAQAEAGVSAIVVVDGAGNVGTLKITVISTQTLSMENANLKVFANRSKINALLLSEDERILWVATNGGLEQRDADTGEVKAVFTTSDGLRSNWVGHLVTDSNGYIWVTGGHDVARSRDNKTWESFDSLGYISSIFADSNGGIWVTGIMDLAYHYPDGTLVRINDSTYSVVEPDGHGGMWIGNRVSSNFGLTHRHADGTAKFFTPNNSDLPGRYVISLLDDNRGVWVGLAETGLAYFHEEDDTWEIFNTENSALPDNKIVTLLDDNKSGIWIGTPNSLVHRHADGVVWEVFNIPEQLNEITSIHTDGRDGLWVGTDNGLARFHADSRWETFDQLNEITSIHTDGRDGLWVGTDNGLARFHADSRWETFDTYSKLPSNSINALASDGSKGFWAGTNSGLVHKHTNGIWETFNTDNSELPNNDIQSLATDEYGGVWIGYGEGGLVHFHADGRWEFFNANNSPNKKINDIYTDNHGGIWIGNQGYLGHYLVHFHADGTWEIFNNDNSPLRLYTYIQSIFVDEDDGIWVGTDSDGLFHRDTNGIWEVFTGDNSGLSSATSILNMAIKYLDNDGKGGIWIATWGGLAHLHADGAWEVFTTENDGLPSDLVSSIFADNQGGIWAGIATKGLAYRSADGTWGNTFKTSYLVDFNAFLEDGYGGIWVGSSDGLLHLTFTQKTVLCDHVDDTDCQTLITTKRAAILIHPKGASSDNQEQERAVDFMATYAYKTLQARGYDNDETYFLSYKPNLDINADAQADINIVDAPVTLTELRNGTNQPRDITLEDIGKAFEWAKDKGKLEQPIIVIFVDHGWPNELLLNPLGSETLTAETFKIMLDDYQNSTDNQVVVIIEACHSGTLVPTLAAPNRLIISSTDAELAYFSDYGRSSFLKLYFDNLRQGKRFGDSLKPVTDVIATYSRPLNQQHPQLNNNTMAQNLCLNGCWGALPGVLTLIPQIPSGQINIGQPIDLTVQTNISTVGVKKVWASMITPEIASQRNEQGYSLQPAPFIPLSLQSTKTRKNDEKWQGSFSKFTTPGDYVVTFKAEDNNGFITDAPPITLTVVGKGLTHARFDATTNIVHIPAVTVGTDIYQADLLVRQFEPSIILEVDMNSLRLADDTTSVGYSNFTPSTGEVYIPLLKVPNATAGIDTYSASLTSIPETSPMQFLLKPKDLKRLP